MLEGCCKLSAASSETHLPALDMLDNIGADLVLQPMPLPEIDVGGQRGVVQLFKVTFQLIQSFVPLVIAHHLKQSKNMWSMNSPSKMSKAGARKETNKVTGINPCNCHKSLAMMMGPL
jgi:hypothetical protein